MADRRRGAATLPAMATVKVVGVLDEAPVVKQTGVGSGKHETDGHFCEVPVRIDVGRLPVRFEGGLAVLVGGYLAETEITLRGTLRQYEWQGTKEPQQRLVVLCTDIDRLRAPELDRIKVVDLT